MSNENRVVGLARMGALASLLAGVGCVAAGPADGESGAAQAAILNGTIVSAADSQGVIRVVSPASGGGVDICTAVALSNTWLLSAAHCFGPQNIAAPQDVELSLGGGTTTAPSVAIAREIILSSLADAALIHLASPMAINGSTTGFERRIYPLSSGTLAGQTVHCMGYGDSNTTGEDDFGWGTLRSADLLIDHVTNGTPFVVVNSSSQALANGDSGGSCFVNLANGSQALVGVASWAAPTKGWAALTGPEALRPWVANTRATQEIYVDAPDGRRRCVDVPTGSLADGAAVNLRECNHGAQDDELRLALIPGNVYELRFAHSGKCLAVPGGSMDAGTPLIQWSCNQLPEQQWALHRVAGTTLYEISNVHSGMYLDVRYGTLTDFAVMEQYWWNGGSNQRFNLEMHPDGQDHMIATTSWSTNCVDVAWASTADSAAINEYGCAGAENQEWRFVDMDAGFYQLRPNTTGADNKCLDVPGASTTSGAHLQQFTCFTPALNEQWRIFRMGEDMMIKNRNSGWCLGSEYHGGPIIQTDCNTAPRWFAR
jgi:hypothetical protein